MGHPVSTLQLQGKIYHTVNRLRSFLSSGHSGHLSHSGHSGHSGHSFPTTTLRRPLSCVFFPVLYSDSYVHLFCQKNSILLTSYYFTYRHHVTFMRRQITRQYVCSVQSDEPAGLDPVPRGRHHLPWPRFWVIRLVMIVYRV